MPAIRTVHAVQRGKTWWLLGDDNARPVADPETNRIVWVDDPHEPLAVFDSLAELFGAWDVASEPHFDVCVYIEGFATFGAFADDDPEHAMEDRGDE